MTVNLEKVDQEIKKIIRDFTQDDVCEIVFRLMANDESIIERVKTYFF